MALSARVINKLPSFSNSARSVLDDAVKEAARDGYIKAKQHAPFDKGGLRSQSHFKKIKQMHQRISFWEEYARFQEFGGDASRRVRNYSTAGTKAHYLKDAGDEQARKISRTFAKHAKRARG